MMFIPFAIFPITTLIKRILSLFTYRQKKIKAIEQLENFNSEILSELTKVLTVIELVLIKHLHLKLARKL